IRPFAALAIVVALSGIPGQDPAPQESGIRHQGVVPGRSKIATQYGIVAASQPLAARAGVQILERGGNAVDAAIATNAVMGLVEPHYNGIGGDLFVMYYEAKTGKLYGLNAGGWAPTGFTPEYLRSKGVTRNISGVWSVTVPGAVKGWEMLRARFGTLPLSDLLAPAIFYADDGFPVTDVISGYWDGDAAVRKLAADPGSAKTFLNNGKPPKSGEVFKNPDLANTMRLIAQ